jgi:hypothetical protein
MKTFTIEFAKNFKQSYNFKMGGTQTIVFPNGQRFEFDDRLYYSGKGSKYNASIKHDSKGDILITMQEVKAAQKVEKERAKAIKLRIKEENERAKRTKAAKKQGLYSIKAEDHGTYIELSKEEAMGKYFDTTRLANTLKISQQDAALLKSTGKTYVFAKSEDGNTYELYHPSLECNYLSICITVATPERIAEFSPKEWQSAPFATIVGQTSNSNHFVC